MAPKSEEKKDAVQTVPGDTAVAVREEIPEWMERCDGVRVGAEHLTPKDVQIPRLGIAQTNSPEVMKGDPKFIKDLRAGESFNDLTGDIYGDGPLKIIIVKSDPPRWMEFDDNRKVVDFNVKAGDPRTEFTTGPDGKRQAPIATMFYDYVILLGPTWDPIALSFKSTGIGDAIKLNGLIQYKPVPIYGCFYELEPGLRKNDYGQWFGYSIRQAGFVKDQGLYKRAKDAFTLFKDRKVDYDAAPAAPPAPEAGPGPLTGEPVPF